MKNLFGLLALILLLASNVNAKNNTCINNNKVEYAKLLAKKHFEGTLTLSGGCVIHYSVDIDYQLIPPRVKSITGSITMSGNCSGTQTFKASATTDDKGTITSVETDLKDKNLQTKEFNEAFKKSLNELNIFEQK